VGTEETHGLGYERVDDDPNVDVLFDTMDATGAWTATRWLRAWERDKLRLDFGERLLDVGCGLGDAALAFVEQVGDEGEIVGVDSSTVGDALALNEPAGYFDVARAERMLQWLTDPPTAVRELARVVRPGGRVSLIDTDWSTLVIDVGDSDLTARVREAMKTERGRSSTVGSRLPQLLRSAGCEFLAKTASTQTWPHWNPEESPAPHGCFSMSSLAEDLVEAGQLRPSERRRFVSTIHQAARDGRFFMALTMFAVVARARPATPT
jgi:SAM-dependent methyltransferase